MNSQLEAVYENGYLCGPSYIGGSSSLFPLILESRVEQITHENVKDKWILVNPVCIGFGCISGSLLAALCR